MFNNANVLFRTKFVDGVSTVQRTVAAKQKWDIEIIPASVRILKSYVVFSENRKEDNACEMLMYLEYHRGGPYFAVFLFI